MSPRRPPRRSERCRQAGRIAFSTLLVLLAACEPHGAPVFPTASKLPEDDRRPDAIAVDLPSSPPTTQHRADAADEVITLRTPLGADAALRAIRHFFQAVVREEVGTLAEVIRPGTQVEDTHREPAGGVKSGRKTREARSWWSQRFRKHDYDELASRLLYRETDVETYRSDQLDALPPDLQRPHATRRPPVAEADLVLRVPIVTHTLRSERLLGDYLVFWLRREGDRYVIFHMAEPFPF